MGGKPVAGGVDDLLTAGIEMLLVDFRQENEPSFLARRLRGDHQVQRNQTGSAPPEDDGNSRKTMVRSLEGSLRRLNTDYVDVFMPHFPDGITPIEEILAGFDELVRSGEILHGGLSNFPAWRVAGAAVHADIRGLAPVVGIEPSVQPTRLNEVSAPGSTLHTKTSRPL